MRRFSTAALALVSVLAFTACGADGDDGGEPNGLETKTGAEVLTAAAAALRDVNSVRVVVEGGEGTGEGGGEASFDLRFDGDDTSGTITNSGVTFDIVRVDGTTYLRSSDPTATALMQGAGPDEWITSDSANFAELSIDGLADELDGQAEFADDAVQQDDDGGGGQPVVVVTTNEGDRYVVANTGPALPLTETHEDDGTLSVTYSEYGADFGIEAPTDVVTPAT